MDGGDSGEVPVKSKPRVVIRFDASVSSPDYTGVFMENGGQIDAMAVRWQSDLAVSGAKYSTVVTFPHTKTTKVELELPEDQFTIDGEYVVLATDIRLNQMTQRMVAAINGTIVHSLTGETSDHVYNVLNGGAHYQMGVTYKTFEGFSATLAVSGVRIMTKENDGTYKRRPCRFEKNDAEVEKMLKAAATIAEEYAKMGWGMRQAVVYEPSPMLHKTVYSEIVGVKGRGYSLLHSIMDREAYMTLDTLNALYETAIGCDCCQDKVDIQAFKSATDRPGLMAALEATTVGNATSLIVNVLMSYRADGRNIVLSTGAGFAPVENWNASAPRSCLESNDCDGLALLAIALIRTAVNLSKEDLEKYEYLRYVRNAVFPHYHVALAVLGASAAEATSADETHSTIAGHAIAVLVPTMSFLRSLARTSGKGIGKGGPKYLESPELQNTVETLRFAAFFPSTTVDQLPASERELLANWNTAKHEFKQLAMLAIEGTTPASSALYVPNPESRVKASKAAQLDKKVFQSAAPNVFRSVKRLHVGSGQEHTFYSALVELTFGPDFPLWISGPIRAKESAATQYVLYDDIDSDEITKAGASPRDLVLERYGAFPLVSVGSMVAHVLDFAAKKAKMDVMPPRVPGPLILDSFQCNSLELSMGHIQRLEGMLAKKTAENKSTEGQHCVAYICAFNTLVHNPDGVKHFVDRLDSIATSGVVDKKVIPGMAQDETGREVGVFLHIDIYSPV
jgi:hypothetical protein